jgi:hypothetical protein
MQTPTGSSNLDPETPERSTTAIPTAASPASEPAAGSKRDHAWPFIVSPYYLSAVGVAFLVVGALQLVWPLLVAGAVLTAIAIAGYVARRR